MTRIEGYGPGNVWELSGTGLNIRHLLTDVELRVWEAALPYQDKRGDIGHAEVVLYNALRLLDTVRADRETVTLAAIGHDIGWCRIPEIERYQAWPLAQKGDPQLRASHQVHSVAILRGILQEVGYQDGSRALRIYDIVSQHDTRKGFLSPEDGTMRDADKLWRFSPVVMLAHRDVASLERDARAIDRDGFFYWPESKKMAKSDTEMTRRWWRENAARYCPSRKI
jgi:hypothetical protein